MINLKPQIVQALSQDTDLINLLGGLTDKYKRIYQYKSPNAEEFPRITYFELGNTGANFADDTETDSEVTMQIDVWCRGTSTSAIAQKVDKVMKSLGFLRENAEDLDEDDEEITIFHKSMRYSITIESEGI